MCFLCSLLFLILILRDVSSFSLFTFNCYVVFHHLEYINLFIFCPRTGSCFQLFSIMNKTASKKIFFPCIRFLVQMRITQRKELAKFFCKETINISGFGGHMICYNYSTLLLWCESSYGNDWVWFCFNKTLQKQAVGRIWYVGYSLQTPALNYTYLKVELLDHRVTYISNFIRH